MAVQSGPGNATPDQGAARPRGGRARTVAIVIAALVIGAVIGSALTRALGPHGMFARPGRPLNAAQAEARIDHMIRRLGARIDATEEQQSKLFAIAHAALKDLWPLREQARAARAGAVGSLTAANVDRDAVESARKELVGLADAASTRFAQALADAANVLSPDQRRRVAEWIAARAPRLAPRQRE